MDSVAFLVSQISHPSKHLYVSVIEYSDHVRLIECVTALAILRVYSAVCINRKRKKTPILKDDVNCQSLGNLQFG